MEIRDTSGKTHEKTLKQNGKDPGKIRGNSMEIREKSMKKWGNSVEQPRKDLGISGLPVDCLSTGWLDGDGGGDAVLLRMAIQRRNSSVAVWIQFNV